MLNFIDASTVDYDGGDTEIEIISCEIDEPETSYDNFVNNYTVKSLTTSCQVCAKLRTELRERGLGFRDLQKAVNHCTCPEADELQKIVANELVYYLERLEISIEMIPKREPTDYIRRRRICDYLIASKSKGIVYDTIVARLKHWLSQFPVQSTAVPKILSYFSLYYPCYIVRDGNIFDIVFEFPPEPVIQVEEIKEAKTEISFRSKAQTFCQSHNSQLYLKHEEGNTEITAFGETRVSPPYRAVEDEQIATIIKIQEELGKIPFKMAKVEGTMIEPEIRVLEKTYNYPLVVEGVQDNVKIVDKGNYVEVSLFQEPVKESSYTIKLGDGIMMKQLKVSPMSKTKRKKVTIMGKEGGYYFSTDVHSSRTEYEDRIEIEHKDDAVVLDLREEILTMKRYPKVNVPIMRQYGGEVSKTPYMFYMFVDHLLRQKPRRICELEFLLSITFANRPKSLGKYLSTIGAIRDARGDRVVWTWGFPSMFYLSAVSYASTLQRIEAIVILGSIAVKDPDKLYQEIKANELFIVGLGLLDFSKVHNSENWEDWLGVPPTFVPVVRERWWRMKSACIIGYTIQELYEYYRQLFFTSYDRVQYYVYRLVKMGRLRQYPGLDPPQFYGEG